MGERGHQLATSAPSDWQSDLTDRQQPRPVNGLQQAEMTTDHRQPGVTNSRSGVVIRVSPQLSENPRDVSSAGGHRLNERGGFSGEDRSRSLPHSECGNNAGKTATKVLGYFVIFQFACTVILCHF